MTIVSLMKVPSLDLGRQYKSIQEEINKAVLEVLASQSFVLGPFVESFEHSMGKILLCRSMPSGYPQVPMQYC